MTERPARQFRVLIVDDERRNRQLLEVMLGEEGYELLLANDGPSAITIATERLPDLVLCDVMMPGMNGYEVAATLQANGATKHVPVVMVSSLDDANSRIHALSSGAVDFLIKPVGRQEIVLRVRNLLRIVKD